MAWNKAAIRASAITGILLFAAPGAAQQVDANRILDLSLEVDGQIMSGRVPEGKTFRLVLGGTDEFQLVPVMAPGQARRVILAVYRSVVDQPETRRMVERRELTIGVPVTLRSHSGIQVVVDGVRARTAATASQTSGLPASAPARRALFASAEDQCCVCCGGACACACGVVMECGNCCVNECCGMIEPTSTEPAAPEILLQSRRFASLTRGTCTRGSLFDRARTPAPPAQETRTALR